MCGHAQIIYPQSEVCKSTKVDLIECLRKVRFCIKIAVFLMTLNSIDVKRVGDCCTEPHRIPVFYIFVFIFWKNKRSNIGCAVLINHGLSMWKDDGMQGDVAEVLRSCSVSPRSIDTVFISNFFSCPTIYATAS